MTVGEVIKVLQTAEDLDAEIGFDIPTLGYLVFDSIEVTTNGKRVITNNGRKIEEKSIFSLMPNGGVLYEYGEWLPNPPKRTWKTGAEMARDALYGKYRIPKYKRRR